jgi:hypothetical protein
VPRLKTAISEVETKEGFADWCRPYVVDLASHCIPGYILEMRKVYHPQEEAKEPPRFDRIMSNYTNQFVDFVSDFEN